MNAHKILSAVALSESAHDGEALAAIRAAARLARSGGRSLLEALREELVGSSNTGPDQARVERLVSDAYERGKRDGSKLLDAAYERGRNEGLRVSADRALLTDRPKTWFLFCKICAALHHDKLSEWEIRFLLNFMGRGFSQPTLKQEPIFRRISRKAGVPMP